MLLWCLQEESAWRVEAVRSTASTAAAAEPKAVEKKIEAGGGLVMEKNDSRLVEWCSERWSCGGLVR